MSSFIETLTRADHQFNLDIRTSVTDAELEAAKDAAELIWNHHIGEPGEFDMLFVGRLPGRKKLPKGPIAFYSPPTGKIAFGMTTLRESPLRLTGPLRETPLHLNGPQKVLFFGAHEVRHQVQDYNGEDLVPSAILHAQGLYEIAEPEVQARESSAHVFRTMFPDLHGKTITYGEYGRKYSIPDESMYDLPNFE